MRSVFLVVATTLSLTSCHTESLCTEDPAFPHSLLGFIKPGMHLGLKSNRTDSLVSIQIFSDEQFRIAKDAREMTIGELGKKHPQVADQAAKALAAFASSGEDQKVRPQVLDSASPGEPTVTLVIDRTVLLCTVRHVGEDYLFVSYGADNMKKQVIAKQTVARIRWVGDDLTFRPSWSTERRQ